MSMPESDALREEAWKQSARPEIRRLVDSTVTVAKFLEIVATSPQKVDLAPALDNLEYMIRNIRVATDTPKGSR